MTLNVKAYFSLVWDTRFPESSELQVTFKRIIGKHTLLN